MRGEFISLLMFTCDDCSFVVSYGARVNRLWTADPCVLCDSRGMGVSPPPASVLDLVESGPPPRWRPPRALVRAGICLAVLAAVIWFAASSHQRGRPADVPSLPTALAPVLMPGPFRIPYRDQTPGALEILLSNQNDSRLVIDSVTLVAAGQPIRAVAPWAHATVVWPHAVDRGLIRDRSSWPRVPKRGMAVASYLGGAVLVVSVHPPCTSRTPVGHVDAVIRYDTGGQHLRQVIRTLPVGGRHWFGYLVNQAGTS
jgi:hypothetical protein